MKIVILDAFTTYPASDTKWEAFAEIGLTEVFDRTKPGQVSARIEDADMVLTNKVALNAETIMAAKKLKYIGVLATGYNIVDIEAARKAGICVTNVPAYSTASVAQTAISLMLALTNHAEAFGMANRDGTWSQCADFTYNYKGEAWHELAGKIFGVVGLGNTGRATAAIAQALGMNIVAYTSKPESELPQRYQKAGLDELFSMADVVSLHCPLTPQTKGLVNARRLKLMKPTALLINTSRGPVVNESALAKALNSGIIAGAGLDVLCKEPPRITNPLLRANNCIITPHVAWASAEARQRLFDIAFESAKAFAAGKPVNVVSCP